MQDAIFEFVMKNPNCTRRDIYGGVKGNEGDIRKCLIAMTRNHRLRETFNIAKVN